MKQLDISVIFCSVILGISIVISSYVTGGDEETWLKTTGSYTGKMFPILRIGNEIFISTEGLKEWLNESTTQRKQY